MDIKQTGYNNTTIILTSFYGKFYPVELAQFELIADLRSGAHKEIWNGTGESEENATFVTRFNATREFNGGNLSMRIYYNGSFKKESNKQTLEIECIAFFFFLFRFDF